MRVLLVACSIVVTVLAFELTFRLARYDFSHQHAAFETTPIYYRQPVVPVGEIFFRRPGPSIWKGKVLSYLLDSRGISADFYKNEAELTIAYDQNGFRNPLTLSDWDIVIVGDSFVELGHLPHEQLFSSQMEQVLGVEVKNIGVSYTGPLSYLFYLAHYGNSESTKHAMMVFCEANDLEDLKREARAYEAYRATGKRTYRNIDKQTSLIKATYATARRAIRRVLGGHPLPYNSYYVHNERKEPVSIVCAPPGWEDITAEERRLLDETIAQWGETARRMGMKPWLVYMPCKRRVLDGYLKFMDHAQRRIREWKASNLPDMVQRMASEHDVEFIDVTPDLKVQARHGVLTFNPIIDTHINRLGATVVSRVIASRVHPWVAHDGRISRSATLQDEGEGQQR